MRGIRAKAFVDDGRQVAFFQQSRPETIIVVVREIRNAIGRAHDASLERFRAVPSGVIDDAVFDFIRQVEPPAAFLKEFHDAQALLIVGKMAGELVHHGFAGMAKRRVTDIMP